MCNTGIIVKVLMLEQRISILMFLLLTVNIVAVLCARVCVSVCLCVWAFA